MSVDFLLQHYLDLTLVGVVLLCAILVYVFGFKKAEQPPFAQLSASSDVDRKFAKKRGKVREKKATNGQITIEKSPSKKMLTGKTEVSKKITSKGDDIDSKLKERKQEDNKSPGSKEKEQSSSKAGKENKVEQMKNKKNLKNSFQEKPVDFDDGDWEQAYSRKDKKNKKKEEESPSKKNKKIPKKADLIDEVKQKEQEKLEIKDKIIKETENKELKEKEKEKEKDVILAPIPHLEMNKAKEFQKEEQNKVEKVTSLIVEKEERKVGKLKKNKKLSEGDSSPASMPSTPKSDNKSVTEEPLKKLVASMEQVASNDAEENKVAQAQEKTAVLEELGDTWTEAKPQKKSKKKARKDN